MAGAGKPARKRVTLAWTRAALAAARLEIDRLRGELAGAVAVGRASERRYVAADGVLKAALAVLHGEMPDVERALRDLYRRRLAEVGPQPPRMPGAVELQRAEDIMCDVDTGVRMATGEHMGAHLDMARKIWGAAGGYTVTAGGTDRSIGGGGGGWVPPGGMKIGGGK